MVSSSLLYTVLNVGCILMLEVQKARIRKKKATSVNLRITEVMLV